MYVQKKIKKKEVQSITGHTKLLNTLMKFIKALATTQRKHPRALRLALHFSSHH